jgi:NAD(P)-dependent dehydrogenase (short-subunit alcohol dehydrogenase family)
MQMQKTWMITGASAGLGRLMTEKLLERGDRVVGTLRRAGALDDLATRYGDQLQIVRLDVTDTGAVRATIRDAFLAMGRIDVVVSNAGYGLFGAAEEVSDAQIDRQIATNLTAAIQVIRASLPFLRDQGGGRIMQVSSEGGQIAYPNFSLYHATKWGIEGFVEAVAQEVAPFGIDFILVEPGPTATSFATAMDHAVPMQVYDNTPAGAVRRGVADGSFAIKGDAAKCADAMIATADAERPALRLALGSTAYESITTALADRLEKIEQQREVAMAADRT